MTIIVLWLGGSLWACAPNDFIVWHLSLRNSTNCYSNQPFNTSKPHYVCHLYSMRSLWRVGAGIVSMVQEWYPPLSSAIYLIFHGLSRLFSSVKQKTAIGSLTVLQKIKTCSWSDLLDLAWKRYRDCHNDPYLKCFVSNFSADRSSKSHSRGLQRNTRSLSFLTDWLLQDRGISLMTFFPDWPHLGCTLD